MTISAKQNSVDVPGWAQQPVRPLVQSRGVLLLLARQGVELLVTHCSPNSTQLLGLSPEQLLGRSLEAALGQGLLMQVLHGLKQLEEADASPLCSIGLVFGLGSAAVALDGGLFRCGAQLGLELLPRPSGGPDEIDLTLESCARLLQRCHRLAGSAGSVMQLCQDMCGLLHQTLGYSSVHLIRTLPDGNSQLLCELPSPPQSAVLGAWFQSLELPPWLRQLHQKSQVVAIGDFQASAAALLAAPGYSDSVDLTYCSLRGFSPAGGELAQVLGIEATLGIALIREQQLWGYIWLTHPHPRWPSLHVQAFGRLLGSLMGMAIAAKELHEREMAQLHARDVLQFLPPLLHKSPRWEQTLMLPELALQQLIPAASVLVCREGVVQQLGQSLPHREQQQLIAFLDENMTEPVWHTEQLSGQTAALSLLCPAYGALLAVRVPQQARSFVVWLRAQRNPTKKRSYPNGELEGGGKRQEGPQRARHRSRSDPFSSGDLQLAEMLRLLLLDAVVKQLEQQRAQHDVELLRIRKAVEAVGEPIYIADANHRVLLANPALLQLTGYTADELQTGSDLQRLLNFPEQILHPEQSDFWSDTVVLRSRGGRSIPVELRIDRVLDDSGKHVGFITMCRGLSERRRAEQRLRLLESAVFHARDAVLISESSLDPEGPLRIVYVNPAFTQLTGYFLSEVRGESPSVLHGKNTDRGTLQRIYAAMQERVPIVAEILSYHKEGHELLTELSLTPLLDPQGTLTHWVSIQRDITARGTGCAFALGKSVPAAA